jgi:hypothetical protein
MQESEFLALPNQFKSLFLSASSMMSGYTKKAESDLSNQADLESVLRLNLQLLKSVEVFVGYVIKNDGSKLIKYPRWTSLTYDIYNESTRKILLCRLKSYDNSQVGASQSELIELPTYNEYFFLNPVSTQEVRYTKKSRMPPSEYRKSIEKQKTSLRNVVLETVEKQSFPANRISSNMLIGIEKSQSQAQPEASENRQSSRRRRRRTRMTRNY